MTKYAPDSICPIYLFFFFFNLCPVDFTLRQIFVTQMFSEDRDIRLIVEIRQSKTMRNGGKCGADNLYFITLKAFRFNVKTK